MQTLMMLWRFCVVTPSAATTFRSCLCKNKKMWESVQSQVRVNIGEGWRAEYRGPGHLATRLSGVTDVLLLTSRTVEGPTGTPSTSFPLPGYAPGIKSHCWLSTKEASNGDFHRLQLACWCRCNLDQLNRKVPIQY